MSRLVVLSFVCISAAHAAPVTASLEVDLSEAPRRVLHARMRMPAQPGHFTLFYPKWIPGEHGPTGPITDLAGLVFRAGDRTLSWRRDLADMYKIVVEVPDGARSIDVALDYLSPPPGHGQFSSGASITQNLAILAWNTVLLYPAGISPRDFIVQASLRLPQGWRYGTALPSSGDGRFSPVPLETLIDSPVLAGAHLRDVPLGENRGAKVTLHVAAETEEEVTLTQEERGWLEQLVREEAALYESRHFNSYHFLLALTDSVPANGIEHHESSDNRLGGRTLVDRELAWSGLVHLLAHESTHSWNGKYRRPASLTTPDYQTPMKGDLLWVYEGLTNYLGTILTARSGSWSPQALRDYFATVADEQRSRIGRRWRPLQDTADAAQLLYEAREDWESLRRRVDYYQEGDLIWLEVDLRLREAGSSLDAFVKRFHGGGDTGPKLVTYTFDDVVRGLEELAPNGGFRELFRARLDRTGDDAPLDGITRAGFRLDYADTPTEFQKARDRDLKALDLRSSIGLLLDPEHERIADVIPGRPADKAGVMPGTKLVAVNGRRFTPDRLVTAVQQTKAGQKLELLIENADTYRSFALDYNGGLRYPRLVPIAGKPDLFQVIAARQARQ